MNGVSLTKSRVRQHAGNQGGSYGSALLDIAQDQLLGYLAENGHFDKDTLSLKGGTALRKCRRGHGGRFSTDLDFVAPDESVVLEVLGAIDGAVVSGFQFSLHESSRDGRHWDMQVTHTHLGQPKVGAAVEFARKPLVLPPERLPFVKLPIHKAYNMELPKIPVVTEVEACAEKLARYRRGKPLERDVYDLAHFASKSLDEKLVRRLWVIKVWGDVVDDGRGEQPLQPSDVLTPRSLKDFKPGSLGDLTQKVDIPLWEQTVRNRFRFLAELDKDEQRWAKCDPRHRSEIRRAISNRGFE